MKGEPAISVAATAGTFLKLSLRTRDPDVAKFRAAVAGAQVEKTFEAWREGAKPISHKQVVALSGEVYRLYVEKFSDEPGAPERWAALKAFNRAAREGRLLNAPVLHPGETQTLEQAVAIFGADLTKGINALPPSTDLAGLEVRLGFFVDWVLQKHALAVDRQTRIRLLIEVERASTDAAWALKRAAEGDYTPDPKAARFPAVASLVSAASLQVLFSKWEAETKPSAATLGTWRGIWRSFAASVGERSDDITKITAADVVAFKDAAVARGLTARTINESYITALKAIFGYAVRNKMRVDNPADGVRVISRTRAGTSMQPYADDEIARLLTLVRREENGGRRWLPWLAATSGARIGELAQLWGNRVTVVNGVHVMRLAPAEDGGSLKNEGSERLVPLHPALIAEGFGDFVARKGAGPLFYRRTSGSTARRHASKGVANHLATWIRNQGFIDPRKAPAHAMRHWFKSAAAKAGIADSLADAIQGHAASNEAGRYRHFDVATLAAAVAAIPIPGTKA
ncbi:integrase [Methylobacterium sp. J-078]|nr:integrase [Methylobacterium sp. J-078]